MLNNKALDYRMNELYKLSRQFEWQHDVRFSMNAYMTNNPIMLKLRVLIHFLYELGDSIKNNKLKDIPENSGKKYDSNTIYGYLIDKMSSRQQCINGFIGECKNSNLLQYNDLDSGTYNFDELKVCLKECVEFFMNFSNLDSSKNSKQGTYITNLGNILNCYAAIVNYAKENRQLIAEDKVNEYVLKGAKNCAQSLGFLDGESRFKWAIEFLLKDLFRQIFYLGRDDGNLNHYWEEICDDKTPYKDFLRNAVEIFMEDQYYNPSKIRDGVINESRFTFIDLKSDLYLFKEMYRFSRDNSERRMKVLTKC